MPERRTGRPRVLLGCLALCVGIGLAPAVHAQSEDEIKAAFLLNFARYVEWPSDAFASDEAPVAICMFESDVFARVVSETVGGKKVGQRSVDIRSVDDTNAAADCHILFLGGGDESEIIRSLEELSVFTVGHVEGFAEQGGIANFIRAGSRIRFEINPRAARNAGLKISSRLLRLAQLVE